MTIQEIPARRWDGSDPGIAGACGFVLSRPGAPDIHVWRGPDEGRAPLLLLPGACEPWHSYAPVLERLCRNYSVWAIDYRGHGPSGCDAAGRYGVVDHLGDVLGVVDRLLPARFAVSGNSLGALLAAGVAAARTDRVTALILEDGPFFITEAARWQDHPLRDRAFGELARRLRMMAALPADATEEAVDILAARPFSFLPWDMTMRAGWADRFRAMLADHMPAPARTVFDQAVDRLAEGGTARWGEVLPRAMLRDATARYRAIDPAAVAAIADAGFSTGFDHTATLGAVSAPTLVIEADRYLSGMLTEADIERLCALLPGSRHVLVEGALHEIHQSRPDAWLDAVTDHLRQHATG